MPYKQERSVVISQMGTVPGRCLENTRIAASPDVPSKYATAHLAAQNADLHPGTPPSGVWVPVFFDFWATVEGVYKNWGHVGWYYNGVFYSDGHRYSSIAAYNKAGHTPVYIGWGELLNGVRIVEFVAAPAPPKPKTHKYLHLDNGTITTTYNSAGSKVGSIYARDNTYNYNVLKDEGYRVQVNSASGGGNGVWIYIIYQTGAQKGKTIPGRELS